MHLKFLKNKVPFHQINHDIIVKWQVKKSNRGLQIFLLMKTLVSLGFYYLKLLKRIYLSKK